MAKLLTAPTKNAVQKTLAAQLLSTATTGDPITFDDVDGIANLPGVLVIRRVDINGVSTPPFREYIEYSGTSGSTVIITTRNVDGSNAALTHPIGSIVEFIPDVVWADRIYDALTNIVDPATLAVDVTKVVTPAGTQTLTNKTLTSPVINTPTGDISTKAGIQNSSYVYAADAGSNDTYVITLSPAPSAYATGQVFHFKANTANTGACTLNVNSLGAKTIKKNNDQDLADNDIEAGQIVSVVYDGTNFQMQSQVANSSSSGGFTSGFRAKRITSVQTIPDAVYTKVQYNSEDYDGLNEYDPATNFRFTATVTGRYLFTAGIYFTANLGSSKEIALALYKNGAIVRQNTVPQAASSDPQSSITSILSLTASDYVEVFVYQDAGGTRDVSTQAFGSWFEGQRLT